MKNNIKQGETVDIIVIGAGHAGCEAALASARLGAETLLFAISLDSVAMMPCNPSIGGTSKGHLVREIDALGGEMGKNIDKTFIQSKMLNTGKGPAVYSLRAQADKAKYSLEMKKTIENTQKLTLKQAEIKDLVIEDNKILGVITETDIFYKAQCVIICAGTYLNSRCLCGEAITLTGPNGMKRSEDLTTCLSKHGIVMQRFKTGTPARIDKRFIDFSKMEEQKGDPKIIPFSFDNTEEDITKNQISCHITYTNFNTHNIIKENIHRSPMYSGVIQGSPTRYCPSIEDKVIRFSDKDRHQVFIEPEGLDTNEMYVQGMSSSLPEDVQVLVYRSMKGLENCRIMRTAYAIEYETIDSTQLKLSLEFKNISGLFSAGQINGSSGYEEAAAQGLIAGINAFLKIKNKEPLIIRRDEGYIGVLIDDLVTKGTNEPYRMMTSRAEYRLLLRQDNADIRLREKGYNVGLIPYDIFLRFTEKKNLISSEIKRIRETIISPSESVNKLLDENSSSPLTTGIKLDELIKRPELSYELLSPIDPLRPPLKDDIREQVNINIKYEGYINRQEKQAEQFKKLENKKIPNPIDYSSIKGLRIEASQKLSDRRPESLGAASRITGVSPADINVLIVYLEKFKGGIS